MDQRRHDGLSVERSRHEEIRRQRIELDQRRHDGLRGGYRRLEGALPVSNRMLSYHRLEGALAVSNRMLSNVSLLDRATAYIKHLEMAQRLLQTRLQQAENETTHLRQCVASKATALYYIDIVHKGSMMLWPQFSSFSSCLSNFRCCYCMLRVTLLLMCRFVARTTSPL